MNTFAIIPIKPVTAKIYATRSGIEENDSVSSLNIPTERTIILPMSPIIVRVFLFINKPPLKIGPANFRRKLYATPKMTNLIYVDFYDSLNGRQFLKHSYLANNSTKYSKPPLILDFLIKVK